MIEIDGKIVSLDILRESFACDLGLCKGICCVEGDSVEIYLTYDAAYGKHYVGMVPAKSAVVWYIDIVSVTK